MLPPLSANIVLCLASGKGKPSRDKEDDYRRDQGSASVPTAENSSSMRYSVRMYHSASIYHGLCMLHVSFLRQKYLDRNSDDTITSFATDCSAAFFVCFPTVPPFPGIHLITIVVMLSSFGLLLVCWCVLAGLA